MKLTPRDRILIVGISLILIAFGFYHFALSPARHRAASLESKIVAAQAQLVQVQGKYAAGRSAAGALRTTAPSFTAAERAVPEQADIPDLLRILARSARASHVRLDSVSLSGSSTSSTTSASTSATSDGGASEVPVTLTFAGGYQALNRLVARLDRLVTVSGDRVHAAGPLVGISSVSLSGASGSSTSGASGSSLTVNITAVVYQRAAATATSAVSTTEGSS